VLLELRVENYAVIDSVVVEFASGLNLLTGETGAGKSILIDALALLLGEKASSDVIRHGAEKAVVSGVFELEDGKCASMVMENNGIEPEGDQIIIRREILPNGRGRVLVSNQPATVAVLRQLASCLASIHSQRESIVSFDTGTRLALLDTYAGSNPAPVGEAFAAWRALRERIAELESDEQDRLRMVDVWSFQKKEIEDARLQAGEDERLEAEKRVLANAEKIHGAAQAAFQILYENRESAAALVRASYRHLQEVARYDSKFQESLSGLESARITIEDIGDALRDYADSVEASPERLAAVEDRLALIDRVKRKYGQTLEAVIAYGAEVSRKLNEIENKDEILGKLKQDLAMAAESYLAAARSVSHARYQAAHKLERVVEAQINELAMNARFKIEVVGTDDEGNWTDGGFDQVNYLIATNTGEPLRPVEEIASGGELSRVMLALKAAVEAGKSGRRRTSGAQRTLVFDEIDIGIGGSAAEAVGRKLKELAQNQQVLCITHLPQIASFADQHYLIEKREMDGRMRTAVRRLTEPGRREEIARMLSGSRLTEASRKHAEQLLKANA